MRMNPKSFHLAWGHWGHWNLSNLKKPISVYEDSSNNGDNQEHKNFNTVIERGKATTRP